MLFLKSKKSLALLAILGGVIWSCSSSKLDRPDTLTYTGPGSFYSIVMNNDGTFSMSVKENYEDSTPFMTIEGEYQPVGNGVTEFVVSTSTTTGDASDAPQKGEKAYGMEAIGFGMFLLPVGGSEVIPMMVQGSCPTDNFNANWIVAQNTEGNPSSDTDRDFFGTFSYNATTGDAEVIKKRNLVDFSQVTGGSGGAFTTDGCEDGFLQISDGSDSANLWLTANGGAMVETLFEGQRNSTIFALPRDSNELSDLEGTFRGILVSNEDSEDDSENFFVEIKFDDAGNGTGFQVTSINPWELGDDGAVMTLAANSNVGAGWYTGTLEVPDESGSTTVNLACTFTQNIDNSNQDVLLCISQTPGANNTMTMLFMKDTN